MAIGRVCTGGGLAEAFAVINVSYPAGSICTCTNGTKILSAENTSGSFPFFIPYAGTWTVSSTNGVYSKSVNVVISSQYQIANVTLSYLLDVYNAGATAYNFSQSGTVCPISRANNRISWTYPVVLDGYTGYFTTTPIDVTYYSTLHANMQFTGGHSNQGIWYFSLSTMANTVHTSATAKTGAQIGYYSCEVTVNVSELTGSHLVGITVGYSTGYCTRIWLD